MASRETRAVTIADIPLVKRLSDKGIILDNELGLTGDAPGANTTLISSLLLPQRSLHTFVARTEREQVLGQFRIKADHNAHIIYVAPHLEEDVEDTAWLHVLDAMAREAGKHGAHCLIAEVEELSCLFQTMRTANFAVYARQKVWRREAGEYQFDIEPVELREATDADAAGVFSLLVTTLPSLIHQIAAPPSDAEGLIYRKDDRVEAYIALNQGKHGIYLIPYMHPDVLSEAAAILEGAVRHASRATKVPVYVCVRRYQDWLEDGLVELGFETIAQQAVMVRHIAAGIRHAAFEPLRQIEAVRNPIPPPTRRVEQPYPFFKKTGVGVITELTTLCTSREFEERGRPTR